MLTNPVNVHLLNYKDGKTKEKTLSDDNNN
jgi:hypothetical protein